MLGWPYGGRSTLDGASWPTSPTNWWDVQAAFPHLPQAVPPKPPSSKAGVYPDSVYLPVHHRPQEKRRKREKPGENGGKTGGKRARKQGENEGKNGGQPGENGEQREGGDVGENGGGGGGGMGKPGEKGGDEGKRGNNEEQRGGGLGEKRGRVGLGAAPGGTIRNCAGHSPALDSSIGPRRHGALRPRVSQDLFHLRRTQTFIGWWKQTYIIPQRFALKLPRKAHWRKVAAEMLLLRNLSDSTVLPAVALCFDNPDVQFAQLLAQKTLRWEHGNAVFNNSHFFVALGGYLKMWRMHETRGRYLFYCDSNPKNWAFSKVRGRARWCA